MIRTCRKSRTGLEPFIARNARWMLAIYWPLLAIGTHTPQYELDPIDLGDTGLDRPVHIACLAILTLLLIYVQSPGKAPGRSARRRVVWAAGVAGVYAVIDEWTQGWFGRSVELGDLIANFVGITLAATAAWIQPPQVVDPHHDPSPSPAATDHCDSTSDPRDATP